MSEEETKKMLPILERILVRLDSMDERLQTLEQHADRQAIETKPIWEQALAEILEVKESVRSLERKFDLEMRVINEDRRRTKVEIEDLRDRIEKAN